ncbi:MAG: hypothetical protein K2P87_05495 [Lachnospiraceae bacterium]|nr:hypothetical protein [Lachnospiraceae bacterium]
MVAFQIREVKNFMAKLFQKDDFDRFTVREGQIQTAAGFQINGHRSHDFYTEEELEELAEPDFMLWEELKPLAFAMIKGTRTPQVVNLVLQLRKEEVQAVLVDSGAKLNAEEIAGAYLNIKFQAGELMVVTGVGFCSFVMDKIFEREFDGWVKKFLTEHGIVFDEM